MNKIDIVLDRDLLEHGIRFYRHLNLDTPSWMFFGESGSGKSVLTKSVIGRIALKHSKTNNNRGFQVTICDGKADDYRFLRGIPNARFFEGLSTAKGVDFYYKQFEERRNDIDTSRDFRLLVAEEWSTFLTEIEIDDKKKYKECFSNMFALTSQGRSFNMHVLLSVQRPDSTFMTGFRENLTTVIGLGKYISPEAAKMAGFNNFKEFSNAGGGKSQGYMRSEDGFFRIQVPKITNFDYLHEKIIEAVTCK